MEAEELSVSLAYDFGYQDQTAATVATAPRPARSSVSNIAAFQDRNDWRRAAERRLIELIRLPAGWDGHQGKPVNAIIASYAYGLLEALLTRPGVPLATLTPLSYGGLMLEWHRKGWDVEIEINTPSSHYVYTYELSSSAENEFWLGARLEALRDVIAKIAD
jgi:hypothetical protein